ncbi:MAG: response regulator [bacterium]|nr:response regulator [bacterium]
MANINQTKILVVDDDPDIREAIRLTLDSVAYNIVEAENGTKAIEQVIAEDPDLIILDLMMPGISGLEVCKRLKESALTSHLPILMLTAKNQIDDKIKGLAIGADEYLSKPFEPLELEARVKALIRQVRRDLYANPMTKLPGNVAIERELQTLIEVKKQFAFAYVDIDNFKAFNDTYGYAAGDSAIKLTARAIIDNVKSFGNADDFVGHIGGDDFVFITSVDKVENICQKLIQTFDGLAPLQYNAEDRKNGFIITKDRQGNTRQFPFITISIAIITNENNDITHHVQVSERAAELKKYLKSLQGSNYLKERRKDKKE